MHVFEGAREEFGGTSSVDEIEEESLDREDAGDSWWPDMVDGRCEHEQVTAELEAHFAELAGSVPMPEPDPNIEPGMAVTGLPAYLETGIEVDYEAISFGELLGTFHVTPVPREVSVDWGDGSVDGPVEAEDGPWPDGELTHAYNDVADLTVGVLQEWDAYWEYEDGEPGVIGDHSGVVRGLQSYSDLGLEVHEIRARRVE
ncbi:hypothetical protein ER308_18035 [Egibacter rhizosphaerae]|uniref:Uncharacterized protein n=1 Tax=Egibacter rhizosphaerae TaxID=1670831 RepID=A0A411YJ95_9ACTN|nr:hypothetical protein ER308_18035 [Egibacter rhizosphaerae]